MKQPFMEFKEHVARARAYYQRLARGYDSSELLRSLVSLASGLKLLAGGAIVGREKMEADSLVQELLQHLNRVEGVQRFVEGGLVYEKGGAKKLLLTMVDAIKRIKADMETETMEQMRDRKLAIDRCLIRGGKLLASGKVAEAEASFQEAVGSYVDEHLLFRLIAEQYMQVGLAKPALRYLDQGLAACPDDPRLYVVGAEAHESLGDLDSARACLEQGMRVLENDADLYARLARLLVKAGDLPAALAAAEQALDIDPGQAMARKIHASLQKRLADQA
ncbi:MAG: tetratricopeptide repeat protein [Desulfovibrionaceae bacterium]